MTTTINPSTRRTPPRHEAPQPTGELSGIRDLIRLQLRLDRIWWVAWIAVIVVFVVSTASAYASLYPTPLSRAGLSLAMGSNAGLRAMYGVPFDLTSTGGFTAWRIGAVNAALMGLMSLLGVIRHTRAEEESGRLELLRAGVVGRHAPLAAAVGVTIAGNVLIGVLVTAGMIANGTPAAGSVALGAALTTTGLVFTGIGVLAAQLSENTRAARGLAIATLATAYLLRAVGDSTDAATWLRWLSPIGWSQQVRPYAGERWWVLTLPVALAVLTVAAATALESRRDLGGGILASRLGPPRAASRLRSPAALAWRLQRGSLLAWTAGVTLFAAALGAIAPAIMDLLAGTPEMEENFRRLSGGQDLVDAFFAAIMPLLAIIATVHAVQAVLRLRAEETDLHVEQLLGTSVPRTRLVWSHLGIAVLSPVLLMSAVGLAAGISYAAVEGRPELVWRVFGAALVLIPAVWVLVGVTMALVGLAPRRAPLAWAALVGCGLLGQLGPLLQLPDSVQRISPYANVPHLPGVPLDRMPLVVLVVVSAALVAAGFLGYRRRDIG